MELPGKFESYPQKKLQIKKVVEESSVYCRVERVSMRFPLHVAVFGKRVHQEFDNRFHTVCT